MIENIKENNEGCHFILLSTEACHLCEDAAELLTDLHQQMKERMLQVNFPLQSDLLFTIETQDIADDEALIEAYGKRIPVLIFPATGDELAWPFDIQQAYMFIYPKLNFQSS
jgi:hypothetical protein